MAGVMIPSPYSKAAPSTARIATHPTRPTGRAGLGQRQGQERHDAALSLVISAHHEAEVLDRDHHGDRPDDQRHDAHDVLRARRYPVPGMQALLQGVQRAGADVAEHHPDRTEDERSCAQTNRRPSRRSGFDRICHLATGRMPPKWNQSDHVPQSLVLAMARQSPQLRPAPTNKLLANGSLSPRSKLATAAAERGQPAGSGVRISGQTLVKFLCNVESDVVGRLL